MTLDQLAETLARIKAQHPDCGAWPMYLDVSGRDWYGLEDVIRYFVEDDTRPFRGIVLSNFRWP